MELEDPATLAGRSPELAANARQPRARRSEPQGRGRHLDRNRWLVVPPPFPLPRGL